jgi:Methyltransferase domain
VSVPRRSLAVFFLASGMVFCTAASAQTPPAQEAYKPIVGQPGKDAVWVPTSPAMVEKMLDMAKVTPQDFVMDLGSGDGRTIIAAAKRGARALGVEYNTDLVEFAKRQAALAGVGEKAQFVQGDMYEADISKATVLALFLLPSNLDKLKAKFLDLPAGTRIVANTFWVEGWMPDESEVMQDFCDSWCTSHLFIIPARVEGSWRMPHGELSLKQAYQMVSGTFTSARGVASPVTGRLRGTRLTITVADVDYEGTVTGDTMEASAKTGPNTAKLSATRVR